jgi:hypothetical protein
VKIQPQWVVTPGKQTNKQTFHLYRLIFLKLGVACLHIMLLGACMFCENRTTKSPTFLVIVNEITFQLAL